MSDNPPGYTTIAKFQHGEVLVSDRRVVVLGVPLAMDDDDPGAHNCDAMGCGSAGPHVVAIVDRPAPTKSTAVDLDELDENEAAMTPGPWTARGCSFSSGSGVQGSGIMNRATKPGGDVGFASGFQDGCDGDDYSAAIANARGIVALRNTHAAIRAELRAARAENTKLRDLLARSAAVSRAEGIASAERDNAREWLARISAALGVHRATAEDESITESWAALGAACVTEAERMRGAIGGRP